MKNHYICIIFCFVLFTNISTLALHAQMQTANYIKTTVMLNNEATETMVSIQYYDGLGRPTQIADGSAGNGMNYVHTLQEYDLNGRESVKWLPISDASSHVLPKSSFTNIQDDVYGYSTTEYDVIGRPVFISTPGTEWHNAGKGKAIEYVTNDRNSVKQYIIDSSGLPTTSEAGYYPPSSLTGERITDEDGHTIETYKDILGKVVLERRDSNNDTYYVYDRGQLRCVVPPKYQTEQSACLLYRYEYDGHGRCIKKTLPGCAYIQYWYDRYGRLAFMQDGRLRDEGKYRYYLYEPLGRLAIQGICESVPSYISTVPAKVEYEPEESGVGCTGYTTRTGYSPSNVQIEIVNYYDGYSFLNNSSVCTYYIGTADLTNNSHANATSFHTGQILSTSNGEYLCSAMYYDEKGNMKEKCETLLGGGTLKTSTGYTFTNKPATNVFQLTKDGTVSTIRDTLEYNSVDKLSAHKLRYGNMTVITASKYYYNDLGYISNRTQHNETISTSYEYDLHGWLTDIHSTLGSSGNTLFREHLRYADTDVNPCYNGNIAEDRWYVDNNTSGYGYKYEYDGLDRLTRAQFNAYGHVDLNRGYTAINDIGTTSYDYDTNSNITYISRHGRTNTGYGENDRLVLSYDGNQLIRVSQAIRPVLAEGAFGFKSNGMPTGGYRYVYDSCGSLISDANKGVAKIDYDLLGNPKRIQFADYSITEYVYAADGRRLKTCHYTSVPRADKLGVGDTATLTAAETLSVDSTMYYGNFVKENTLLSRFDFDGGYVVAPFTMRRYKYYIKDHLGNNRVVTDYSGAVQQQNHFYPYGGPHHFSTDAEYQKYKYNGKEYDSMHGLNEYDYGARRYDPVIGMFTSMDPLCEKYYHISPYSYCGGNPVSRVDPDGMDWYIFDQNGKLTIEKNVNEDCVEVNNPYKYNFNCEADFGKSVWQLHLPYNTINSEKSREANGYALLEVYGDTNGRQVFEFLSEATNCEWSQAKLGENEQGENILTCSHQVDEENGMMNYLLSEDAPNFIRELNHSHPNGHISPSGLSKNGSNKADLRGDIYFGNYFLTKHPEITRFNIYTPTTGKYHDYTNYLKH